MRIMPHTTSKYNCQMDKGLNVFFKKWKPKVLLLENTVTNSCITWGLYKTQYLDTTK